MVRELPHPATLREAAREVISSNRRDGYPPTRFIQATEAGEANNLSAVCSHLIVNPDTLSWLVEAVRRIRGLLFLEDLVSVYGYGLPPEVIEEAKRRCQALDELVGGKRWIPSKVEP